MSIYKPCTPCYMVYLKKKNVLKNINLKTWSKFKLVKKSYRNVVLRDRNGFLKNWVCIPFNLDPPWLPVIYHICRRFWTASKPSHLRLHSSFDMKVTCLLPGSSTYPAQLQKPSVVKKTLGVTWMIYSEQDN